MFEQTIVPRLSETDALGHINNTVIAIWFESAKIEIFKLFSPTSTLDALNAHQWKLILVNMSIDYKKQVYFGINVKIKTWIKKIGNTSFVVYQELLQNGEVCAFGDSTLVHFDFEYQKTIPIPGEIRSILEGHLIESG